MTGQSAKPANTALTRVAVFVGVFPRVCKNICKGQPKYAIIRERVEEGRAHTLCVHAWTRGARIYVSSNVRICARARQRVCVCVRASI